MKRKIITVDREKCDGCGLCLPECPEGALQIIDGKATLVSDLFCDGLGACLGECPRGALSVEEREAEPYDEKVVMEKHIIPKGQNVIKAHLTHLKSHGEDEYYKTAIKTLEEKGIPLPGEEQTPFAFTCPGQQPRTFKPDNTPPSSAGKSQLTQWPVQMKLIHPDNSDFSGADLLISADCVPYAYGDFHNRFLKGRKVITFCPKLDEGIEEYVQKLSLIFARHEIKSVTVLRMQVPCCFGTTRIVEEALKRAGKVMVIREYVISSDGRIL
jgi:ferredoxin